ncbi:CsbD family protein [Prosthecobacter sp.]|uniref:CsbD family protein n=1 Tax=Prosthecobacter sp. TaxID=1965333 RepID=UPI003782F269
MNAMTAQGDWNILKGKLKQTWARITHNTLKKVEGRTDELIGRIQKRTGASRQVIEKAMRECDAEHFV